MVVFLLSVALLSLIHLSVLTLTARNPAMVWAAFIISTGFLFWHNRHRRHSISRLLPPFILSVLVITTIADLLINTLPFEGNPTVNKAYRHFLTMLMFALPIITSALYSKRQFRPILPAFAFATLLLPPFSYDLNVAFQTPLYGRITALLYVCFLWPRLRFNRSDLLLFLPAASALPALIYAPSGHSPGNTIEHIQFWTIFAIAAIYIRHRIYHSKLQQNLIGLLSAMALLHAAFVIKFNWLHSINSNVTSMYLEAMLIFGYIFLFDAKFKSSSKAFLTCLWFFFILWVSVRIGSDTGTIVILFSTAVFLSSYLIYGLLKYRLLRLSIPISIGTVIAAASSYLLFFNQSHTIKARRLIWEAALNGIFETPMQFLFGTGDFGPYHLYLFRHLLRPLTDSDELVLVKEPFLISQHPHNDLILSLYGGGIVYVLIVGFLLLLMIRNSRKLTPVYRAGAVAFTSVMLLHGLTEPFSTATTTGFLLFLALAIFAPASSAQILQSSISSMTKRTGNVVLFLLVFYFSALAAIQIPVTRFWRADHTLFMMLHVIIPLDTSRINQQEVTSVKQRLHLLTQLAPYEADYFRQAGDAALIEALIEEKATSVKPPENLAEVDYYYCKAFALKSSPIHYRMLHRLDPTLDHICKDQPLRQELKTFDPHDLLLRRDSNGKSIF